ncbi:MAG TPA: POTRA domain-containing protein, partial [Chthonomonadaceae bacterium]|nr:POTRA domain-containing protein [Chthonomonadaceae bacterium]
MRIGTCRTAQFAPLMALLPASLTLWTETQALAQTAPVPKPAPPVSALPDTHRIDRITVVGARALSPVAIVVMSGHKEGDPCNQQTLNEMRTNLIQTGNFGMHHPDDPDEWVRVRTEPSALHPELCNVIVIVDENDKIERTTITGSGPIKPEEIQTLLHPGPVYNMEQFKRDLNAIQALYHKRGYVMEFGADAGPDPNQPGVLILPVQVARITEIRIVGNHKTRAYVIRRELDSQEGEFFNRITVNTDAQRLVNLDLFKDIVPVETLIGPGQVRIVLNVVEMSTGSYGGGGSYGQTQGVVGFVEVSDRNFRGAGEMLALHV